MGVSIAAFLSAFLRLFLGGTSEVQRVAVAVERWSPPTSEATWDDTPQALEVRVDSLSGGDHDLSSLPLLLPKHVVDYSRGFAAKD